MGKVFQVRDAIPVMPGATEQYRNAREELHRSGLCILGERQERSAFRSLCAKGGRS